MKREDGEEDEWEVEEGGIERKEGVKERKAKRREEGGEANGKGQRIRKSREKREQVKKKGDNGG